MVLETANRQSRVEDARCADLALEQAVGSHRSFEALPLAKVGFDAIDIETTRVYSIEDARTFLAGEGLDVDALAKDVDGTFISGFIRASKPSAGACCGPSCCTSDSR